MYDERFEEIIISSSSRCELPNIEKIIRYCSLVPEHSQIIIRKKWYDSFGCCLHINKSKTITINKFCINKEINIDKYCLSLNDCLKLTTKICIVSGVDDCTNEKYRYYTCYCIDNKIRSYLFFNNTTKPCSSLLLGYDILSSFIDSINKFGQIKTSCKILDFCQSEILVIDNYPLSKELDF